MDINTEGIQALILTFIKSLANLDLKALDFDFLGDLLTKFSAIWNPIWEKVRLLIKKHFWAGLSHGRPVFFARLRGRTPINIV